MQIFIPSLGRSQDQVTLGQLPPEWRDRTTLVVRKDEKKQYALHNPSMNIAVAPAGIGPTRDWIIANSNDYKILMLDDDLLFYKRRGDDKTKFGDIIGGDLDCMLRHMESHLDKYAHIGLCPREGGNRLIDNQHNVRLLRVLGFHQAVLQSIPQRFSDVHLMEDFHINLSLLRAGYSSLMLSQWCHNQSGGSNAPGGCSTYRTMQAQGKAAHKLAELHAPFVKVVTKKTKTAWGGQERQDVIIQWKQAAAAGGIV